jgi:hypothetical protein
MYNTGTALRPDACYLWIGGGSYFGRREIFFPTASTTVSCNVNTDGQQRYCVCISEFDAPYGCSKQGNTYVFNHKLPVTYKNSAAGCIYDPVQNEISWNINVEFQEVLSGQPDLSVTQEECEAYGLSIDKWGYSYDWTDPSGCVKLNDGKIYYNTRSTTASCSFAEVACIQKVEVADQGLPCDSTKCICKRASVSNTRFESGTEDTTLQGSVKLRKSYTKQNVVIGNVADDNIHNLDFDLHHAINKTLHLENFLVPKSKALDVFYRKQEPYDTTEFTFLYETVISGQEYRPATPFLTLEEAKASCNQDSSSCFGVTRKVKDGVEFILRHDGVSSDDLGVYGQFYIERIYFSIANIPAFVRIGSPNDFDQQNLELFCNTYPSCFAYGNYLPDTDPNWSNAGSDLGNYAMFFYKEFAIRQPGYLEVVYNSGNGYVSTFFDALVACETSANCEGISRVKEETNNVLFLTKFALDGNIVINTNPIDDFKLYVEAPQTSSSHSTITFDAFDYTQDNNKIITSNGTPLTFLGQEILAKSSLSVSSCHTVCKNHAGYKVSDYYEHSSQLKTCLCAKSIQTSETVIVRVTSGSSSRQVSAADCEAYANALGLTFRNYNTGTEPRGCYHRYYVGDNSIRYNPCSGWACPGCSNTFKCLQYGPSHHDIRTHCFTGHEFRDGFCQTCTAGKYFSSITGISACLNCAAGKSSYVMSNACFDCAMGEYSASGGLCNSCAAGKYASGSGDINICIDCAAGTYQNEPGQTTCKACPATTTSLEGSTNIVDCNICFAHYYRDTDDTCKLCPNGKTSISEGAVGVADCQNCEVGKYGDQGMCIPCSTINRYQDQVGQVSCKTCPVGKDVPSTTLLATSVNDCEECDHRIEYFDGICRTCPKGKFIIQQQKAVKDYATVSSSTMIQMQQIITLEDCIYYSELASKTFLISDSADGIGCVLLSNQIIYYTATIAANVANFTVVTETDKPDAYEMQCNTDTAVSCIVYSLPATSLDDCVSCPAGYFANPVDSARAYAIAFEECEACEAGKYQSGTAQVHGLKVYYSGNDPSSYILLTKKECYELVFLQNVLFDSTHPSYLDFSNSYSYFLKILATNYFWSEVNSVNYPKGCFVHAIYSQTTASLTITYNSNLDSTLGPVNNVGEYMYAITRDANTYFASDSNCVNCPVGKYKEQAPNTKSIFDIHLNPQNHFIHQTEGFPVLILNAQKCEEYAQLVSKTIQYETAYWDPPGCVLVDNALYYNNQMLSKMLCHQLSFASSVTNTACITINLKHTFYRFMKENIPTTESILTVNECKALEFDISIDGELQIINDDTRPPGCLLERSQNTYLDMLKYNENTASTITCVGRSLDSLDGDSTVLNTVCVVRNTKGSSVGKEYDAVAYNNEKCTSNNIAESCFKAVEFQKDSCTTCPSGKTTSNVGATDSLACTFCAAGKFIEYKKYTVVSSESLQNAGSILTAAECKEFHDLYADTASFQIITSHASSVFPVGCSCSAFYTFGDISSFETDSPTCQYVKYKTNDGNIKTTNEYNTYYGTHNAYKTRIVVRSDKLGSTCEDCPAGLYRREGANFFRKSSLLNTERSYHRTYFDIHNEKDFEAAANSFLGYDIIFKEPTTNTGFYSGTYTTYQSGYSIFLSNGKHLFNFLHNGTTLRRQDKLSIYYGYALVKYEGADPNVISNTCLNCGDGYYLPSSVVNAQDMMNCLAVPKGHKKVTETTVEVCPFDYYSWTTNTWYFKTWGAPDKKYGIGFTLGECDGLAEVKTSGEITFQSSTSRPFGCYVQWGSCTSYDENIYSQMQVIYNENTESTVGCSRSYQCVEHGKATECSVCPSGRSQRWNALWTRYGDADAWIDEIQTQPETKKDDVSGCKCQP